LEDNAQAMGATYEGKRVGQSHLVNHEFLSR